MMTKGKSLVDYVYTIKEMDINPLIHSTNIFSIWRGKRLLKKVYKSIKSIPYNLLKISVKDMYDLLDIINEGYTICIGNSNDVDYNIRGNYPVLRLENSFYRDYGDDAYNNISCAPSNKSHFYININNNEFLYYIEANRRKKNITVKIFKDNYTYIKRYKKEVSEEYVDGIFDENARTGRMMIQKAFKFLLLYYLDNNTLIKDVQ